MENKINAEDLVKNQEVNAGKWAAAFMQIFGSDLRRIDEGLMISWFANAIMVAHDKISNAKDAEIEQLKAEDICKDLKITIQHDKITALKSKLKIAVEALEYVAAEGDRSGSRFRSERQHDLAIAGQALTEIGGEI